jgi:hypothetical protein
MRLPLDSDLPTNVQTREIDQARIVLMDRCMKRFGFGYRVELPDVTGAPKDPNSRRYGITDARLAAEKGYGLAADDPSNQPRPVAPRLSADAQTVLYGEGSSTVSGKPVPTGGCLSEANRALDAKSPKGADFSATQELAYTSFKQSQADSRVRQAVRAWSACMATRGYHYADTFAPGSDPRLGDGTGPAAIRTAEADLACKSRTNLVGIWFTVESAYQERLIDEHASSVKATAAALAARIKFAAELTNSASG